MARVGITGGTGLVGMRLSEILKEKGHDVFHFSRTKNLKAKFPAYQWNLEKGEIDEAALASADHLILLAGAGIVDKKWTDKRKAILIDSRVKGIELIAKKLNKINHRPRSVIAASAIGFYGDRGDQIPAWSHSRARVTRGIIV